MQQTTVQNGNAIRFGSGKVEVGDDINSLVDLGAMKGVKFEETWDEIEVESDNAGTVTLGTSNHKASIAGDLMEIELANLAEVRGGIDKYETIPGVLVPNATQTVKAGDWSYDDFIKIENQNGDGTAITVNSVTGATDGALIAGDDYILGKNEKGEYGIFIQDGTTLTAENQDLVVDYDYTPNKAVKLSSGGKTTINPKVVRITNVNELGKKFQITIFKARNSQGISIELKSDESGEVATTPLNLTGELDANRDPGAQLFEIYDEQSVR